MSALLALSDDRIAQETRRATPVAAAEAEWRRGLPRRRLGTLLTASILLMSCAGHQRPSALAPGDCAVVVYDLTPHALEIRLGAGAFASTPVGMLNPGEVLNYSVPCAHGGVWVTGIPIPSQVGARVSFRSVDAWAALVPGARADVALQWP